MTCAVCSVGDPALGGQAEVAHAVTFDAAGVGVSLHSHDARWRERAAERWGGFPAPSGFLRVVYEVAATVGSDRAMPLADHGGELHVVAPPFAARVSADRTRAHIAGPLETFPVDVLLRDLLPELLVDGLVLHGCGLAGEDGRGFLCCGASGSGKSTLASLLPDRALSDELVAVRRTAAGFRLIAMPYWQARPGSAALAGIHLLRHGPEHRRRPIAPAESVRRLLPHVLWPVHDAAALERSFATLAALVASIPCWDLEFAPRADVWDAIAAPP